MATHASVLVWRIPWTEEPVDYSPWGPKDLDRTECTHTHTHTHTHNHCLWLLENILADISLDRRMRFQNMPSG